jgi:hypothetical protein
VVKVKSRVPFIRRCWLICTFFDTISPEIIWRILWRLRYFRNTKSNYAISFFEWSVDKYYSASNFDAYWRIFRWDNVSSLGHERCS